MPAESPGFGKISPGERLTALAAVSVIQLGLALALLIGLRVQLSRRFLNDVVRAARVVRRKMVVRYLRLAGHADWPATAEFDDTPPETLSGGVFT